VAALAALEGEGPAHHPTRLGPSRHCGPTGRRKAPPDDRLRDAIQSVKLGSRDWIASSLALLAMTRRAPKGRRLSRRALLVLAMLDQIVDHGGIRQRRGIAEASRLVLGDLAQDAAHDLAGAGLGQARRELDLVGRRDRADVLAHPRHQFLAQLLAGLGAGHQRHYVTLM